MMALLAAVMAESAVLGMACLRARRVRTWWAATDLIFGYLYGGARMLHDRVPRTMETLARGSGR
jgi:hypothetical protein